jgi:hypothetical protein
MMLSGCGFRPAAVRPPKINVAALAEAAMQQCDADRNGSIEGEELDASPSLQFALDRIDNNQDGKIDAAEIEQFAQHQWEDQGTGIIRVRCVVALDGKLLDGATVTLEPEDFMLGAIRPASGVTRGGTANLDVSDEDRPHPNAHGAQHGLYLVRVSKQVNGQETIPARYNEQTTLGCEVAYRASYMPGPLRLDLTSR